MNVLYLRHVEFIRRQIDTNLHQYFSDINESMNRVLDEIEKQYHTRIDYPVGMFAIAFGFLLVLMVEQSVLWFQEKWRTSDQRRLSVRSDDDHPRETDALLSSSNYGSIQVIADSGIAEMVDK